ncbi:Serine/threonine-protein kinase [Plenodomus lindquistii]|nr:Serine/threonine-protein kinase [Plenodomus lindquistii]
MATPSNPYAPRRSGASPSTSSAAPEQIIGKFKRMDHIGKGSFAEVYRGIHIEKRASVAIKSVNMNKLNKKLKDNLVSEIAILRSLHHPHIVSLIDCQEAPSRMHIIMEFCELGDLSAFIKKRADLVNHPQTQRMLEKYPNPAVGGLNEVIVRHFAKQMASALEFIRSKNYIHRDLKPQNLLLNPSSMFYSQSGTLERMPLAASANSLIPATGIESLPMLKIADFGFARILPTTSLAETLCGSPLYMAPEILRYEKYDAKADLWSVGTVLFEMMCARPPFRANNHVELLRKIEERRDQIRFPEGIISSRAMKNLIRALLKKKPTERMSYESFFSDPVIRDVIPDLVDEDLPRSMQASEAEPPLEPPKRIQKMPAEMSRGASDSSYSRSPKDRTGLDTTPPSRPSSRPLSGNFSSTPPRTTQTARRASNTPIEPIDEHAPSREHRRPVLTNAATAPGRTLTLQDQAASPNAIGHRRRFSRDDQAPAPSGLKEHLDRERAPQRAEATTLREAAERAAQDNSIDDGFVFVEKRRVEIDALADEIANSPQTRFDKMGCHQTKMKRRSTTQGLPLAETGSSAPASAPSQAIQIQRQTAGMHQRAGSYERRRPYRPSFESATSALTKAMNMVNIRGLGMSPPVVKGLSPPHGYSGFPQYPAPAPSSMLIVGEGGRSSPKDEDVAVVKKIEELAQMSHVVYGFAEVKYRQLVPVPPSDQGLGIGPAGVVRKPSTDVIEDDDEDDDLTPDMVLIISEEALVLYCKALAMLSKAMEVTGTYWTRKNEAASRANASSTRLSQVVSWVRDRFNECCAKSDLIANKLKQAQSQLPPDHPAHPQNASTAGVASATTVGSAENIFLTTGVTAEKLMYDRAIEMSRQAAVDELTGHNLAGCDVNYFTAIQMLDAILEEEDTEASKHRNEADEINGLDGEDRASIAKLLEQMRARHRALKRKLDAQKHQKRGSVGSAQHATSLPSHTGRGSPASLR